MVRSAAAAIAFVTLVVIASVARLPAQQAQSPIQTELLTEVRLLRQAIESLAGTNARVQIVFGRLQLQEQRTASAARRLDDLQNALSALNMRAGEAAERVKEVETSIAAAEGRRKPEEIEGMQEALAMMRREAQRLESERTRLMTEEADAASTLNQEQGRWSDLNRQLEQLERALVKQ